MIIYKTCLLNIKIIVLISVSHNFISLLQHLLIQREKMQLMRITTRPTKKGWVEAKYLIFQTADSTAMKNIVKFENILEVKYCKHIFLPFL